MRPGDTHNGEMNMSDKFETAFNYFREICSIPHGTYHIDAISDYLAGFAREHNLKYVQDELKNVIIYKPATEGYEKEEPIMLQGHMDMVAVCDNPSEKNMEKEGLELAQEDGFLYAKGTSLGADDGIAIAYILTILESDDISHPALEAIFTANEEVGMDGALGVDLSHSASKRLINIDSEEEGVITVSCAGGLRVNSLFTGKTESITAPCVFLSLDGLLGGHSGTEIDKGRANGAHLLAEVLEEIAEEYEMHLISMASGEKDNSIPSSGSAEFLICDLGDPDEFMNFVEEIEDHYRNKYEGIEENITLTVGIQLPQECICYTQEDTDRFLEYLVEVPDGIISMCDEIDMVQTSLNLGILKCTAEGMRVAFALRSSVRAEKEALTERILKISETYGGEAVASGDYPSWEYKEHSPLRDRAVSVYERMYGKTPVVTGVHAGLECGILAEKIEGLEAISIGPNIENVHTTKERLDLGSARRGLEYVLEILRDKS